MHATGNPTDATALAACDGDEHGANKGKLTQRVEMYRRGVFTEV